mmetsp:Transcript_33348/g.57107  ORF Transcript_33348/g.57107 Transcript_33348/m.57107 type:complete len:247 (-) Transcript_33348:605-1345(-)
MLHREARKEFRVALLAQLQQRRVVNAFLKHGAALQGRNGFRGDQRQDRIFVLAALDPLLGNGLLGEHLLAQNHRTLFGPGQQVGGHWGNQINTRKTLFKTRGRLDNQRIVVDGLPERWCGAFTLDVQLHGGALVLLAFQERLKPLDRIGKAFFCIPKAIQIIRTDGVLVIVETRPGIIDAMEAVVEAAFVVDKGIVGVINFLLDFHHSPGVSGVVLELLPLGHIGRFNTRFHCCRQCGLTEQCILR